MVAGATAVMVIAGRLLDIAALTSCCPRRCSIYYDIHVKFIATLFLPLRHGVKIKRALK
jgi:hypothetical protein